MTNSGSMKKVCGGLKNRPAKQPLPSHKAQNFFLLIFLNGPGIALMGSLQIGTGSALGKLSCVCRS